MGYIKTGNISTTIMKNDILNNGIKELYLDNVYNHLKNILKDTTTLDKIKNDLENLDTSLIKLNSFIDNYINDYNNINSYLSTGKYNNINSNMVKDIISKSITIDELYLKDFNVPDKKIAINYNEHRDDKNE